MTTTLWRTDAPTEGRPGRRWWRIAVVVAVVIGAAYLLGRGGQPGSDAAYHPENPSAKGAQAVASDCNVTSRRSEDLLTTMVVSPSIGAR